MPIVFNETLRAGAPRPGVSNVLLEFLRKVNVSEQILSPTGADDGDALDDEDDVDAIVATAKDLMVKIFLFFFARRESGGRGVLEQIRASTSSKASEEVIHVRENG
eukprot:4985116-Prymnesium_polylepis.1